VRQRKAELKEFKLHTMI